MPKGHNKNTKGRPSIPAPVNPGFSLVHNRKILVEGGTEDIAPSFSFIYLDARSECPSSWNSTEIRELFDLFRQASSLPWSQVRTHCGIRFKSINVRDCRRTLPSNISDDVAMSEMRVTDKARIFGVKHETVYYVIWLDRNHQNLPE